MRYFIEFAYNGAGFHGWQIQPNAPSVQQTLNSALSLILRQEILTTGAGRTDTGVHASQMFAHFDTDSQFDPANLTAKLNALLPGSIAVKQIFSVPDRMHARFDAVKRTYQYHISLAKDPFNESTAWKCLRPLDLAAMESASALLLSHSNFECFSKVNTDVNTFNCRIFEARWEKNGAALTFTISADRFLRNMVRAIVGTLVDVGLGKTTLDEFTNILESRDRKKAGSSAPAHGLFLTNIEYDFKVSPD